MRSHDLVYLKACQLRETKLAVYCDSLDFSPIRRCGDEAVVYIDGPVVADPACVSPLLPLHPASSIHNKPRGPLRVRADAEQWYPT